MLAFLFSFWNIWNIKFSSLKKAFSLLSFFSFLISFSYLTEGFDSQYCRGSSRAEKICPKNKQDSIEVGELTEEQMKNLSGVKLGEGEGDGFQSIILNGEPIGNINDGNISINKEFSGMEAYSSGEIPTAGTPQAEKSCPDGFTYATTCCTDPMTCLGGEALSTANEVNKVVTTVGPGLGMALQGGGQDMSGMCKAIQALAGTGASLSAAAHMKCTSSISSCESGCKRDIAKNCQEYKRKKNRCKQVEFICNRPYGGYQCKTNYAYRPFESAKKQAELIIRDDKIKLQQCPTLKPKAGELASNIGQMATSAISAELCKQQASLIDGKDDCKAAGGQWNGYDCDTSQRDQCVANGGQWLNNTCDNSTEQACAANGGRWINNQCDTGKEERCVADGGEWIEGQCQFGKPRCLAQGGTWSLRQCNIDHTGRDNCIAEGGKWKDNQCDMNARDECIADEGQWREGYCDLDEARCVADGGKWEHRRCIPSEEHADCVTGGGQWLNQQCDTSKKEDCVADGGEWKNNYCSLDEARCVADGGKWELRRCIAANPDDPDAEADGENDTDDGTDGDEETKFTVNDAPDDPITGDEDVAGNSKGLSLQKERPPGESDESDGLGGGGNLMGGIVSPGSSSSGIGNNFGSALDGIDSDSDDNKVSSSGGGSSGGGSSGGFGRGGFGSLGGGSSYRGGGRRAGSPYRAGNKGKFGGMGGGGFSNYGGGGGDDSDDYAGLGLSKKKLKELEKKQGAKRKIASESKGAHQNIFERISKRFQSLCQNRLDCR